VDIAFEKIKEHGLNGRLVLHSSHLLKCTPLGRASYDGAGHWGDLVQFIGKLRQAYYGWVENLRWVVSADQEYIKISDDDDDVFVTMTDIREGSSPLTRMLSLRVYTTSDKFLVIAIMFLDRVMDGLRTQYEARKNLEQWVQDIETAKETIRAATKFPEWESSLGEEAKSDPLMQALVERYRRDHEVVINKASKTILFSILKTCWSHGVRFVSISGDDLVCFEDVRTERLPIGKPMAWHLGSILGFDDWGNGPHARANLWRFLKDEDSGCYDLRGGEGQWVCPDLNFSDTAWRLHQKEIETVYNGSVPLENWFTQCGAFRRVQTVTKTTEIVKSPHYERWFIELDHHQQIDLGLTEADWRYFGRKGIHARFNEEVEAWLASNIKEDRRYVVPYELSVTVAQTHAVMTFWSERDANLFRLFWL
jgi:hypothetical protein